MTMAHAPEVAPAPDGAPPVTPVVEGKLAGMDPPPPRVGLLALSCNLPASVPL